MFGRPPRRRREQPLSRAEAVRHPWLESKISRLELGRVSFKLRDVTALLHVRVMTPGARRARIVTASTSPAGASPPNLLADGSMISCLRSRPPDQTCGAFLPLPDADQNTQGDRDPRMVYCRARADLQSRYGCGEVVRRPNAPKCGRSSTSPCCTADRWMQLMLAQIGMSRATTGPYHPEVVPYQLSGYVEKSFPSCASMSRTANVVYTLTSRRARPGNRSDNDSLVFDI